MQNEVRTHISLIFLLLFQSSSGKNVKDGVIDNPGFPNDGKPCPKEGITWVRRHVHKEEEGEEILKDI